MALNFDLISDLYLSTLENFTWEGKATSLFCIVAGNISDDHDIVLAFLELLEDHYEGVFYIDGDIEHERFNGNFDASYASLREGIEMMERVFFLHENIMLLPGVALLATNGWTTFDFTNKNTVDESMTFLDDQEMVPLKVSNDIFKMAVTDQHYLYNSIEAVQDMLDVDNVIIVTNSVPCTEFITHNDDYDGTILGDTCGNNGIRTCLTKDLYSKVKTWLFGKYPAELEYNVDNVRYVSNPKVHKDMDIYYPKIIKP